MNFSSEEGYIKFRYGWIPARLPEMDLSELISYRQKLYDLNLIGAYAEGIGFGNISQRYRNNQFIISASGSGNDAQLDASHFCLVDDFDLAKNWLSCIGNLPASSESLSHAAIYSTNSQINVVVHIHHPEIWSKQIDVFPTSDKTAEFGTVEMAESLKQTLQKMETSHGIIIMGGHPDGILLFAENYISLNEIIFNLHQLHI
ncbi:MAG TPA: rRNA adenine methyltransferase [Bacteroidales bacterium]|nr:rRNA adenine methyltransferase [Bacteroidales bacterium]